MKDFELPTDLVIRPSSLAGYLDCQHKWFRIHILKQYSKPNIRAAQGTAMHSGAEHIWHQAMATADKEGITEPCFTRDLSVQPNVSDARDKAVEDLRNLIGRGDMEFEEGLDANTAEQNAINGVNAFAVGIVPATLIPEEVEYKMEKTFEDHPVVAKVAGTADYLGHGLIADIKSSKSKIVPYRYTLQQGTYKMLAEHNGIEITDTLIHSIVKTKTKPTETAIDSVFVNIPQVNYVIEHILKKLELLYQGVDPDVLFAGNQSSNLCSETWCAFRTECKFIHGIKPIPFSSDPEGEDF